MIESTHIGWASAVGPLPVSILSSAEGVLDIRLQTLTRCLADLPETLRETLISALRAEISEGLAKAYLAGRQAACSDLATPCSLCAAAGGEGCESPTCQRP